MTAKQTKSIRFSGLNTNRDRRTCWERVLLEYGQGSLEKALSTIDPTSARVLTWHYAHGYSLKDITGLRNRSISVVRNHHSRGMFELQQYYLSHYPSDSF